MDPLKGLRGLQVSVNHNLRTVSLTKREKITRKREGSITEIPWRKDVGRGFQIMVATGLSHIWVQCCPKLLGE